jgi:Flp pilus assembly protein TadB
MTLGRVVILLAIAASLVAGAFHYAKRAGYNEAVAQCEKAAKERAIEDVQKSMRIRNASDAISELRQRAAAKRKASL